MKPIDMNSFVIFLLTCITTIGWSQEFPQGKWKVNTEQTMVQQRDMEKVRLDTMSLQSKNNIKSHLDDRIYSFQTNGKFELGVSVKGKAISYFGSWRIKKDILTLSFENGDKADYIYSPFGEGWLLKMNGSIKEDALVNNLVLTSID